ncbi:MAG TPA: Do family serine endopeptidase [Acidobacteriaceae bacterium]|nr:Do family serine endopeptidase [Acidobacteriaceae bacterium]
MTSESVRKTRWGIFAAVAIGLLTVGGVLRAGILPLPGGQATGHSVPLKFDRNPAPVNVGNFQNGYASVIDPDLPAVVNIESTKVIKEQNNFPGFFNQPFFQQFFGQQMQPQQPQTEREQDLGSGVIVNASGYIITNNHVIAGAQDIEVFTQNRQEYKAKLIGTDTQTDIAVLKIDATDLPTLTLGDSGHLRVGDLVFAIGDPFGIGQTATMGIVSATNRAPGGIEHYENFIQTDAAINPGNSGGALIDIHGDLIGINTAIISGEDGGGNEGIGFAIPINMAVNVFNQIVENGKVVRGYLGVHIEPVNPAMAKAFGLSHGGGALINDVSPDGPAAKAGLERGDIIEDLNGHPILDGEELSVEISEMAPGSVAHLTVFRNGQTIQKDVTLGTFPTMGKGEAANGAAPGAALKGLAVQSLTPSLRQQLNLPSGIEGVVVSNVDPNSAAAAADVQQGDVIEEVNRRPVHSMDEYQAAASSIGDQPALLLLYRNGTTFYLVVQPQ